MEAWMSFSRSFAVVGFNPHDNPKDLKATQVRLLRKNNPDKEPADLRKAVLKSNLLGPARHVLKDEVLRSKIAVYVPKPDPEHPTFLEALDKSSKSDLKRMHRKFSAHKGQAVQEQKEVIYQQLLLNRGIIPDNMERYTEVGGDDDEIIASIKLDSHKSRGQLRLEIKSISDDIFEVEYRLKQLTRERSSE